MDLMIPRDTALSFVHPPTTKVTSLGGFQFIHRLDCIILLCILLTPTFAAMGGQAIPLTKSETGNQMLVSE